jgi:multiple sugar transport system ATP-binding protein
MAPVTIDNIRKSYGNLDVMHGVSVDIEDGEFMVLVGPSGCGKSTLLRMIAGLESITDGSIRIGSRIINDVAPKDRDIAMVFQNYALYPHMTVRENMAFALRLRKMAAQEIDKRIEQAAGILGLSALLDRYPRQLSGGQRQRVAMGRATVRDPQVFLFDEPLSNLDAKLRVTMRSEIKSLHQRLRTTTVYVTHDQVEAMTMADRIVVMHNGVVEQIGTPLDLYDRPGNLFVAGFIGSPSMNFIEGTVRLRQRATFSGPEGFAMDPPRTSDDRFRGDTGGSRGGGAYRLGNARDGAMRHTECHMCAAGAAAGEAGGHDPSQCEHRCPASLRPAVRRTPAFIIRPASAMHQATTLC